MFIVQASAAKASTEGDPMRVESSRHAGRSVAPAGCWLSPCDAAVARCGHRNEAGLTTLGWLLVVASVAGLASVAVVLVQREVALSGGRVVSHSARQEAAELATAELVRRWLGEAPGSAQEAERLNREFVARCRRIGILYADIDLGCGVLPARARGSERG